MRDDADSGMSERFRTALDIFEFGESMMRQRIARENPELAPEEIEVRLGEWLSTRPGAESGDAVGRAGRWPRTSGR